MAHQYYNGKLYIVASEDRNSDKRPLHHIVIDLGITTTPPANQAPIVSFRTPSTNLTVNVGYNLAVEAIANDSDGSINNVKLYINNSFIRQENAAPYTWGQPNTELNGRDPGTYTIKAVATDNQGATGEKSFVLTVNNTTSNVAVSSVSLSPPTVNLTIGQSRQLTHAISPTNATNRNVTFTSSNTNIATVSNTGLVRAVANGNTTITIKTADGNKTDTSVVTVARSTLNTCAFGTPRTSALPSTNTSYTKMYVLGNGGPTISNFRELQVNWDARYNGLYVFAFSTTNGVPDWYNDLKPRITQNFNVSSPSITISNSGISGLDGAYWVTKNGADFAMVSKTQGYTLYFSTSTTAPSCGITAREAEPKDLVVYPNPAKESITISKELALGTKITISDMQGIVLIQRQIDSKDTKIEVSKLHAGMYVLLIETKYTVEKTIFNIID